MIIFFDLQGRRPAVRASRVWLADDFYCPPDQAGGWKSLRDKISNGADIAPHLSTFHESVINHEEYDLTYLREQEDLEPHPNGPMPRHLM